MVEEAGLGHGLAGGEQGKLGAALGEGELGGGEGGGVELLYLRDVGEAEGGVGNAVFRDVGPDSGFSGKKRFPDRAGRVADGRKAAQTCDDDPIHPRASLPCSSLRVRPESRCGMRGVE